MFKRRQLHCSFCGKDESEVAKLVAGPKVYICDACVALASEIMDRSDDDARATPQRSASWWSGWFTRFVKPAARMDVERSVATDAREAAVS